ncbi:MAG: hypothetical protein F6K56_04635 [Moorea sp. SIO3G5]|nr:hypothetical protein [Moorena sp. SIO3G5]
MSGGTTVCLSASDSTNAIVKILFNRTRKLKIRSFCFYETNAQKGNRDRDLPSTIPLGNAAWVLCSPSIVKNFFSVPPLGLRDD